MIDSNNSTNIGTLIEELLNYAKTKLWLEDDDVMLKRNFLLDLFRLSEPAEHPVEGFRPLQELADALTSYGVENGLCTEKERLLFETRVFGAVTPLPSVVTKRFEETYVENGPENATKELLELETACNYIRKADIDKNLIWDVPTEKGTIKITINLSKPEKDPKDVLEASKAKAINYPKCMLCYQNEGFAGNATRPARQTLRTIPVFLNNELWHLQFSPYSYFDNHCICFSDEHRPMDINNNTFMRMLDFIDLFPHYFIGSNACLPIVGGSILAHDHYQGGSKVLPEMGAGIAKYYSNPLFDNVKIGIVDWFNSVIRIIGTDKNTMALAADYFTEKWSNYDDKSVNIKSHTKDTPHNTVTPITRMDDENNYIIDLILRNNRTDKAHPYGIFHPTEDIHNIKKEAIGIIEVMGLFILPGRLAKEALEIRDFLTGATPLSFKDLAEPNHPLNKHLGMIAQLANDNGTNLTPEEAERKITEYINNTCVKILQITAVFKNDNEGKLAFDNFMNYCGCN